MKPDIFISHSSDDKNLALLLKQLFDANIKTFCTSDIKAVEGGTVWFQKIIDALRDTKICISVLTPNSIYRPWVYFESGGSYTLSSTNQINLRMFPVCAYGLNVNEIPAPLSLIQARNLANKSELALLYSEVMSILKINRVQPSPKLIKIINEESKKGIKQWGNVHLTLAGERLDSSPFSLDNLLNSATRHIFIAGQNLNHLATNKITKAKLLNWLSEDIKRKAQILMCDPNEKEAVRAWDIVGSNYEKDLVASIKTLKKWSTEPKIKKIGKRLDIRVTKLVTTSLNIFDPDLHTGKLVITPVVFGKPISSERPHFAIDKKYNKQIFNHYWDTYRDKFDRGTKLKDV